MQDATAVMAVLPASHPLPGILAYLCLLVVYLTFCITVWDDLRFTKVEGQLLRQEPEVTLF